MKVRPTRRWRLPAGTAALAALALGAANATDVAHGDRPGGSGGAPLLTAAGDIACHPASPYFRDGRGTARFCRQEATSRLLPGADVVVPLGDTQMGHADLWSYQRSYDPTWGRHLAISRPVIGNHEYGPPRDPNRGADDYWGYFGEGRAGPRGQGWYAFDLGAWHVVGLNSLCRSSRRPRLMQRVVGCGRRSRQVRWLKRDLAQNPSRCILASWHHPRFSSGTWKQWRDVSPLWRALQRAGADVVLSGHVHAYERFANQNTRGVRSRKGIRQFVVGTGGHSLSKRFRYVRANSQRRVRKFGVLRLRLKSGNRWRFVPIGGGAPLDGGATSCRN